MKKFYLVSLIMTFLSGWSYALGSAVNVVAISGSTPTVNSDGGIQVHLMNGGSGGTSSNFGATFPSVGTAVGGIGPSGTMQTFAVDSSSNIKVNVVAGGAGGGVAQLQVKDPNSSSWINVSTAASNGTTIQHLPVALQGTGANTIEPLNSSPAGTEYALPTRNIPSGTQAVSGTFWQATQPVSQGGAPWTVQTASATTALPTTYTPGLNYLTMTTTGTLRTDLSTMGGTTLTANADGGIPMHINGGSIANTAFTANAGTNLNTSALALESGGNLATLAGGITNAKYMVNISSVGTAPIDTNSGNKSAGTQRNVLATDSPAIANWGLGATASAVPSGAHYVGGNASGNLTGITVCDNWTAINQIAGTQLITGVTAKKTYICSINLVTATAQNIALVGGTGTTCATTPHAIAGGTTAATGWNLAANGGLTQGTGVGVIMQAATAADNVCLLQSGTGQVSGTISWTQY